MWVSSIVINNIKSFEDSGVINLDKRMNILIGPNNAGKSVIIKALYLLQDQNAFDWQDVRRGASEGKIVIGLEAIDEQYYIQAYQTEHGYIPKVHITILGNNSAAKNMLVIKRSGESVGVGALPQSEPNNFIYPFLAKRK